VCSSDLVGTNQSIAHAAPAGTNQSIAHAAPAGTNQSIAHAAPAGQKTLHQAPRVSEQARTRLSLGSSYKHVQ
jgi:hypothetical protein